MTEQQEAGIDLEKLALDPVVAPPTLTRDVMSRLRPKADIAVWFRASIWRPIYASALPLLFGFLLGMYWPEDATDHGLDDLLLADSQIELVFDDIDSFGTGALDE